MFGSEDSVNIDTKEICPRVWHGNRWLSIVLKWWIVVFALLNFMFVLL